MGATTSEPAVMDSGRRVEQMAHQRATTPVVFGTLTIVTGLLVPVLLYVVSARAVEHPAPDLWWLTLLPLAPGAVAAWTSRQRVATAAMVVAVVALTVYVGLIAAYAGDSRASQAIEAREYDDACNTADSGLSVPFRVDAAFEDVGRVESHHLHGPTAGGDRGCTMAVAGQADDAFAAWRSRLLASGWRVVRDDAEVVVARRGVELSLAVVDDAAYLTAAEVRVDPCEAGRPQPGEAARVDDTEVAVASPPCS